MRTRDIHRKRKERERGREGEREKEREKERERKREKQREPFHTLIVTAEQITSLPTGSFKILSNRSNADRTESDTSVC